jgi:CRISPR-associated endonuclease Csn1
MALGLDLGVSSLGWALLKLDPSTQEPFGVIALGARIFPAGVEGDIESGREESRGVKRRQRRLQRRQLWRRARRDASVFRRLQEAHLLPPANARSPEERHSVLLTLDREVASWLRGRGHTEAQIGERGAYLLRQAALDTPLPAHFVGRAIYHLAQRRGFLSNRLADITGEDDAGEELGKVKGGIQSLDTQIAASGARTLGEYLASRSSAEGVRRRYTARTMLKDEFERIWTAQHAFNPEQITPAAHDVIERAIFRQRPLKSQRHLVARCELEPRARRAMIADPLFQEFRILQRVNDLRIEHSEFVSRPLTTDERTLVVETLMSSSELTFVALRKLLKLARTDKFNLERGGEKRLVGHRTFARLTVALGYDPTTLATDDLDRLVQLLVFCEREDTIRRVGTEYLQLDAEHAGWLGLTALEPGTASFSRRALRRLLVPMRAGVPFSTARHELYPPLPSPPRTALPPVNRVVRSLRNPAVLRSLTELRHVVNAIVQRFGAPDVVRVELARNMKRPRKVRQDMAKTMRERESERNEARTLLERELGLTQVSRSDIEKYLLFKECNGECPYTGQRIVLRDLFSKTPTVDVEHIIPYAQSLDDSFANKTLCVAAENRRVKQRRSPFEAYAGDANRWAEILARVDRFKGSGRRRKAQLFRMETLPAEFADRQLNDTRHASVLAQDYVGLLFGGAVDADGRRRVHASSGGVTAQVRRTYHLSQLLGGDGEKTRGDHRHHAVDAVAIAATTPWIVSRLQSAAGRADARPGRTPKIADIDNTVRDAVADALQSLTVSHRRPRGDGALHDESFYGTHADGSTVIRKGVADLSLSGLADIIDPVVRQRVIAAADGREPKIAFANENWPTMPSGVPIKRVRISKSDTVVPVGAGSRQRLVKPNGNSHLEVFVKDDGTRVQWRIVTRLDAYRRRAAGASVVDRTPPADGWRYLGVLRVGDMLQRAITQSDGTRLRETLVLENISQDQFEARRHDDARPAAVRRKTPGSRIRITGSSFIRERIHRVSIDALGAIRPSNA